MKRFTQKLINVAMTLVMAGTYVIGAVKPVSAVVQNPTAAAKVSFTFDDGYTSALTQAAPTLAKYGLTGTNYVISNCVDMSSVPNTCHADDSTAYMTWDQVNTLKNTYGWEIASHSATHPYLASSDADDGQPNKLTIDQVRKELIDSKAAFAAHGINTTDFATPYGDYLPPTLAEIAKVYATHRGFADIGYNPYPYNEYLLRDQQVQNNVKVATVKSYIDQAIANKTWLVLSFHEIRQSPRRGSGSYDYSTANLDQIAAYVKSKQNAGLIQSINVNQGAVTSDTNLLSNASFNNALGTDWTTDSINITRDTGNNGSYPDPTNAVKLVSSSTATHLYSPEVVVDPNTTYLLKNFLNVQKLTSGEVGFYIDEYDANGTWVSGQFKTAESSVWVENLNFTYKPTSANVSRARLQVIVSANSGITAYLDNAQWFALSTVTPPVVNPPVTTNLVANGTFDNGIADGWTTDSAATMVKDTANNGSPANPVNSIKMISTTKNTHLSSPKVTVSNLKTYALSCFLNLKSISSGEVGFYIDEYDVNDNWISGQYKTGVRALSNGTVNIAYTPTSVAVSKASLQVIVTANANILAFFDNVTWYQN